MPPDPQDREQRKATLAVLLGITPTPESPRAAESPAYALAPRVGLTCYSRSVGGDWWTWGVSNHSGHGIDLFTSRQAPADDYDPLPDLEEAAARYTGTRRAP